MNLLQKRKYFFSFLLVCTLDEETFNVRQFIILQDVFFPSEKNSFKLETDLNARHFLLDIDSKMTDLGRSFPIELAATGSCLAEMEVLNRCLRYHNGK